MRSHDLAPLLHRPQRDGLEFGQGVIRSYDPLTAANEVEYRGTILRDLPVLNGSEAVLLAPGAVVGILRSGSSFFILGRVTVPNTPDAASALDMVRIYAKSESSVVTVNSETYTDLGGPRVDNVLISRSGRALLFISAWIRVVTPDLTIDTSGIYASADISGATTRSPDDDWALRFQLSSTHSDQHSLGGQVRATAVSYIEGLNPGLHTFRVLYRVLYANNATKQVSDRTLVVIPF